jgi:thermostable 8-oxoguanine DNA glycosylase
MYAFIDGSVRKLDLPSPNAYVLPGIRWGMFDDLMTPAYWRGQAWQHGRLGTYDDLRLGRSLVEEVAACLLGGYGMPADVALAAYWRLRENGMLERNACSAEIEESLSTPFIINGRTKRYRFARQKARYLNACLEQLPAFAISDDDRSFRDDLAQLPGIGLKTASWIVRNIRSSNAVAILDVHILRAGRHIGLFPEAWVPERHYRELEKRFIMFANAIDVAPPMLDGLMWDYMRRLSSVLLNSEHESAVQLRLFRGSTSS